MHVNLLRHTHTHLISPVESKKLSRRRKVDLENTTSNPDINCGSLSCPTLSFCPHASYLQAAGASVLLCNMWLFHGITFWTVNGMEGVLLFSSAHVLWAGRITSVQHHRQQTPPCTLEAREKRVTACGIHENNSLVFTIHNTSPCCGRSQVRPSPTKSAGIAAPAQ